jgi:hypothetical protein
MRVKAGMILVTRKAMAMILKRTMIITVLTIPVIVALERLMQQERLVR